MTTLARFVGGPQDGSERRVGVPTPHRVEFIEGSTCAEYEYVGFEHGVLYYRYAHVTQLAA